MKRSIIFILGFTLFLSSCTFVGNIKKYSKSSKELIYSIINEDYIKAYDLFAYEKYGDIPMDTFVLQMSAFRKKIVDNFGTDFDLSFVSAEKTTFKTGESGPHPTKAQIQLKNSIHYGYITLLFDDEVKKVGIIHIENIKNEIPSMTFFWLFGLIPILIVGFNIYTIRRVAKSNVNRKWLKIIGIVILNVPAITYSVVNGFKFELLSFQIFLGMSLGLMGYIGTFWTFGIPIGSLIANFKINKLKNSVNSEDIDITNNE